MRAIVVTAAVVLLAGCSATYQQSPVQHSGESLERGAAIAIVVPENASFEAENYPRSGAYTADALEAAWRGYAGNITQVAGCSDVACANRKVTTHQLDYVVIPHIDHWEDRSTEWSGKPDRIEVAVVVYDAKTGERLVSTEISGKSQWATMGGDHPQDLLTEPVNDFVSSLY